MVKRTLTKFLAFFLLVMFTLSSEGASTYAEMLLGDSGSTSDRLQVTNSPLPALEKSNPETSTGSLST